jgi:uncharacterized membrane protein
MRNIVRPLWQYRQVFLRSEVDHMLMRSMLFGVLMVLARTVYTGKYDFCFLLWNLFLAYIPYFISGWLQRKLSWIEHRGKFSLAFIVWLLFIPNSFYILTDLFHLGGHTGAPLWYDLALIITFAWNGLLLGILSVRQMEKMIQVYLPGKMEWLFLYPVMVLNALGVYIGRYLRFNSWDIITNPFALVTDIAQLVWHPLQFKEAWAMVTCFSVLMILVYSTLKRISKMIW